MAKSATSGPQKVTRTAAQGDGQIELKDPGTAAVLDWLVPGLGHWYQGRRQKAVLFFVCVLGTFVYGLYLGEGRVVYASWRPEDRRLPFLCQVGVGLPALVAVVQSQRERPIDFPIYDRFMVPPSLVPDRFAGEQGDELDQLQKRLHHFWELGTVYTMIAGLLNILAIYDAWGGPAYTAPQTQLGKKEDDESPEGGSSQDTPRRDGSG